MRLIDADKLIKDIVKLLQPARPDETEMYKADDIFWSLEKLIKEQPTAFDVDKVVRKLELLIMDEECKLIGSSKHAFKETLKKRECYKKALEIVKAGGIDET